MSGMTHQNFLNIASVHLFAPHIVKYSTNNIADLFTAAQRENRLISQFFGLIVTLGTVKKNYRMVKMKQQSN